MLSRAGTLAAAGTDLMLDPTTVGRRVVKFERRIGANRSEPNARSSEGIGATKVSFGSLQTRYVERYGQPSEKPDGHRLVLFARSPAFRRESAWLEERIPGATVAVRADSVSAPYAAAVAGSGIALLPTVAASPDPDLVRIDLDGAPEPRQIWQALHSDLRGAARIRAATGFLAEIFSRQTETTAPLRLKAVGPSNPSNVDALGASGLMRHVATSDRDRRA